MPDLSHLRKLIPGLLITVVMPSENDVMTQKARLHRRNFIRLIDKAIAEYQYARHHLVAQIHERERPSEEIANGRLIYFFSIINHLENCINAARRLTAISDRLKAEGNSSIQLVPRDIRRHLDSFYKDIVNVRDAIEHIDERIHKGEVTDGPVMLSISKNEDKVSLAGFELSFYQLASLLNKYHELGDHLLNVSPNSWP